MFNKSKNFIRRLNRGNFYLTPEFSNLLANYRDMEVIKNTNFQLKLCLIGEKTLGHGGVNIYRYI